MNILIIDDSQGDHDIVMESLKESGGEYRFYHAYDAQEGIALFRQQAVDCILLDYHMPGQNGLEVLKLLAEENRGVPVVMMTGEGNEFVAVNAMKLGSQDYLSKRVLTTAALKRAVDRAVERAEMIRRMEQYRADLERSNHDLEQFANIVAHDLKAPLRAVTQHLTLIVNNNAQSLDEKSRRSLEFAVEGATRMRQLIDALFDYARLGFSEPEFSTVSLEILLEQTKRDLSSIIEEREARITHDALPEVKGDNILLAQLLQNLIANAIKYCKEKPHIHISAARENNRWRIRVQDNGIGIPASQHQHIFVIFRRLHVEADYPGVGLGLAICDRIVKQHGGLMEVESKPGSGSCFHFTLPEAARGSDQEKRMSHG